MTAEEYIKKVLYREYRPFATVMVAAGRAYTHRKLKPGDEIPDEDEDNTVVIHLDGVT